LNDADIFQLSLLGRGQFQLPPNPFLLADGGFPAVVPLPVPDEIHIAEQNMVLAEANRIQMSLRAGVEMAFRNLKIRKSASAKCGWP